MKFLTRHVEKRPHTVYDFPRFLKDTASDSLPVAATLFLCWLLFNTSSGSPGIVNPYSAYANMTGLYAYFVIFLAVYFFVDFSAAGKQRLHFFLLAALLASYPFFFVYTHYAVLLDNPRTGSFPYYQAILGAREIPWSQIFSDPWVVLASIRFGSGGPLISQLSPLLRTKMPGFALTAKLLSYVVFNHWTYLLAVSSLALVSQLLIARALLPDSLEKGKWYLLALLPTAGFVIFPYGVEQVCTIYLGLCLFFLHRFKQSGHLELLLASLLFGALLVLGWAAAGELIPFIVAFALFDNPFKKKTIIAGTLLATLIIFALHWYFTLATTREATTLLDYYRTRAGSELAQVPDRPQSWRIPSVLALVCIVWGPVFLVSLPHMIFKPLGKWTLLFWSAVLPVMAHAYLAGAGESYRNAYANQIVSFFVCIGLITASLGAGGGMGQEIQLKILAAGSVLSGILFHKLYAVPEVRLRPFNGDVPPHPMWGGWEYNLSREQSITPEIFLISFALWVLCLNLRRDATSVAAAAAYAPGGRLKRALAEIRTPFSGRANRRRLALFSLQVLAIVVFAVALMTLLRGAFGRDNLLVNPASPHAWAYTKPECVEGRVLARYPISGRSDPVIHLFNDALCPTFEMYRYHRNIPDRWLRLEADVYIGETRGLGKSGFYVSWFDAKGRQVASLAVILAGDADYFNPENMLSDSGPFFRATKVIHNRPGRWNHVSLDLSQEYDTLVKTHLRQNQEKYLFENLSISDAMLEIISWTQGDGKVEAAYDRLKLIPRGRERRTG